MLKNSYLFVLTILFSIALSSNAANSDLIEIRKIDPPKLELENIK